MVKTNTYTEKELVNGLIDLAEELNKTPTKLDVELCLSVPSSQTYHNRFGSFNNALREAGLQVNKEDKRGR